MPRTSNRQYLIRSAFSNSKNCNRLFALSVLKWVLAGRRDKKKNKEEKEQEEEQQEETPCPVPSLSPLVPALGLVYLARKRLNYLLTHRYSVPRETYMKTDRFVAKCESDLQEGTGAWLNDARFRKQYGMARVQFHELVELIQDHPVFHRKTKNRANVGSSQPRVEYQLMVFLSYLRTIGDGFSNHKARQTFFIAEGTIEIYKSRVLLALISHYKKYIYWPSERERREIAIGFQERGCPFQKCVGALDGTLIPLAFKPEVEQYADYSGRVHRYSLNCMAVCDNECRIRYLNLGWPGTVHDERVLDRSAMSSSWFTEGEYVFADSAYTQRDWLVSPYKRSPRSGPMLEPQKEIFNTVVSSSRMKIEHTFGILKGRFQFLKGLRMKVKDGAETDRKIQRYITVACMLHNMLVGIEVLVGC